MDKSERAKIVTVKLEEVLAEELTRELKENRMLSKNAETTFENSPEYQEWLQLRDKMNALRNQINEQVSKFNKEHENDMTARFHGDKISKDGFKVEIYEDPDEIRWYNKNRSYRYDPPEIKHTLIVSELVARRKDPNLRIQKVAKLGLDLLVKDDMAAMEKFLEM